jgi:hypothetical protein
MANMTDEDEIRRRADRLCELRAKLAAAESVGDSDYRGADVALRTTQDD